MKIEDITKALFVEMFKRVGLDYTYEEIAEYAKPDFWWTKKTWTMEQEKEFSSWAYTFIKKNSQWTKSTVKREISYFLLMWGWSYEDGSAK
jgi:hypothetical protein